MVISRCSESQQCVLRAMMSNSKQEYHLLRVEDQTGERTYFLSTPIISIGRESSNAILIDDPSVSRHHAMLVRLRMPSETSEYSYQIVDGDIKGQQSKNGVWVNHGVYQSKILAPGDLIQIGSALLCYMITWMTPEEYKQYFDAQPLVFHSLKTEVLDPTVTLTADFYEVA